ncbi:ABC transporter permease [Treponema lecithinolyticum]|uniref:ABC transporter, permease protein n=1 Tax=Treponema lecithinolyticum ATCC 700332 TaxID=1321815 RepID=A0ABN0P0H7_TRELE|nr:ABC transporter permease subunit [Treponema lecithinolyticum]ERJ93901.1 ABC transporter, permease protein [Treponema lecithinolyticum ATCC 700332]
MKEKKKTYRFKSDIELALLAVPGLLWLLIFCYLPLVGNFIAFKDFKIFEGGFLHSLFKSAWVGFKNFAYLFASSETKIILRNTIGYNFIFIVLNTVIPIITAIALNELWNRNASKLYQSIMFFPYFLSWVVISYFLQAFLDPTKGMINKLLINAGGEYINFYLEPGYWPYLLIFLYVWKSLGYGTVMYLAAIIGIDKSLYEAAMLDGAGKLQQIRYITLNFLKPVATVLIVLAVGKILNSDFGLFYQVPKNSGALFSVTQTLDTYVYRAMIGLGDMGMTSAAVLFQSSVGFVLVVCVNQFIKKIDPDNALF